MRKEWTNIELPPKDARELLDSWHAGKYAWNMEMKKVHVKNVKTGKKEVRTLVRVDRESAALAICVAYPHALIGGIYNDEEPWEDEPTVRRR